jgi:hypothetical protein
VCVLFVFYQKNYMNESSYFSFVLFISCNCFLVQLTTRFTKNNYLVVNRDLYELLLLNFIRGGYFERVMVIIGHMNYHELYTEKFLYKREFLILHKNLHMSLKVSDTRTEAQSKRLVHVQEFRK